MTKPAEQITAKLIKKTDELHYFFLKYRINCK